MSVDSVFVHKMWNDNELSKMVDGGVPFPVLSDGGGKVGAVYGVYDEDAGVETRGRFLIDPDGVIQAYEVVTPPVGRHIDETLRQIQEFEEALENTQGISDVVLYETQISRVDRNSLRGTAGAASVGGYGSFGGRSSDSDRGGLFSRGGRGLAGLSGMMGGRGRVGSTFQGSQYQSPQLLEENLIFQFMMDIKL